MGGELIGLTTHVSLLERLADETDRAAWREFHDRYADLLRGFARRRGLQPADADEIVQDVLFALQKSLPGFTYDPEKGKFRSYLKTVALRTIFRNSGQNHRPAQLQQIEEATRVAALDEDVDAAWEAEWRDHHLRRAMRLITVDFSERDRNAFQLYAVEDQPVVAVAEALGMSTDAVYQVKSRILKRLSAIIAEQVAAEG